MITLKQESMIAHARPDQVFQSLADPNGLTNLLPRIEEVHYTPTGENQAHIVMAVRIGAAFGTIRCEGTLTWEPNQTLTLTIHTPLPVRTHWTFQPDDTGTRMTIHFQLDLVPLLGPFAAYVPTESVRQLIRAELRHAIEHVAQKLRHTRHSESPLHPASAHYTASASAS